MAAIADRYRGTSSFLWRRAFRYSVARNERGQIMDTPVGPREQSESTDSAAQDSYDVIVLGAGPVGQNVAARARAAGLTVAVIERELVGGECSYWGCIPSKSLLRPVIAGADARRVQGACEAVDGSIAPAGVFARRDRYVTNWDDSGQAESVEAMDVALVRGHARLDG